MATRLILVSCFLSISLLCIIPFVIATVFDSGEYEILVQINEPGPWGDVFDSASYQIRVDITGQGGSSSNSSYWEFYELSNRYDVYNPGSGVDVNDFAIVRNMFDEDYNYFYDVFPDYIGDDQIDINDLGAVRVHYD